VLELWTGAIPKRANIGSASVVAGNHSMLNARVAFESGVGDFSVSRARVGGDVPAMCYGAEGVNFCRVLEPDRNPWILVVIIHEEAMNQFRRMAYFGGIFGGGEVSVRAMNYSHEYPYPIRATIDVAGKWKLRDFSQFLVNLLLSCLGQCFGR
jgi:hypothetical protein